MEYPQSQSFGAPFGQDDKRRSRARFVEQGSGVDGVRPGFECGWRVERAEASGRRFSNGDAEWRMESGGRDREETGGGGRLKAGS